MVLAENPETGEIAYKRVVQTFENESYELVHVFVNGEEIITTPNHPFYVPKLGWTSAIKLRAGDILVLSNGEYVVVEAVQHEILESPVKVYNFEVEDFHTYFVGESSVLVHNKCTSPNGRNGGKSHRLKTEEIKNSIDSRGNRIKTEDMFTPREGYIGYKNKRFADVVEYDGDEIVGIYQVGKVNKNGLPVSRESKAIEDIMNSYKYNGAPIYFIPYNSDIGSIIYMY